MTSSRTIHNCPYQSLDFSISFLINLIVYNKRSLKTSRCFFVLHMPRRIPFVCLHTRLTKTDSDLDVLWTAMFILGEISLFTVSLS